MFRRGYLLFLIIVASFALIIAASLLYLNPGVKKVVDNTVTPTPILSLSPSIVPTSKVSEEVTPAQINEVKIYLIAIGDDGTLGDKVGCGDSLVPVTRKITPTFTPLKAALNELLSIKTRELGNSGLYNSLYQSSLKLESAEIDAQGHAIVKLSGKVQLGGVCDDPRFKEQIIRTISQFSTVKKTTVLINGEPIDRVVSEK